MEFTPSQPTTYRARTVAGPSGPVSSTSTPSSSCDSPVISVPKSSTAPAFSAAACNASSVRACGMDRLNGNGVSSSP
ncbi:hypothetical protein SALBM217S_00415 [Streptomyces griseoloalbus]